MKLAAEETTIVVATDLGETWIGVIESGRVMELDVRPDGERPWAGAIVQARVVEVREDLGGSFLDVGRALPAFLPDRQSDRVRTTRPGERLVVQIEREADGGKGDRATSRVVLDGYAAVLIPGGRERGASRGVADEEARRRLVRAAERLAPAGHGLILRRSAEGLDEGAIRDEVAALVRRWEETSRVASHAPAPSVLQWPASRLEERLDRAAARGPVRLIVGKPGDARDRGAKIPGERSSRLSRVAHSGPNPMIESYGLDRALDEALSAAVSLSGGGRLLIDRTEALHVIDVDSRGREGGQSSVRDEVNREAADEAARQIRLRDLSGLIVIDFVGGEDARGSARIASRLQGALERDSRRTKVAAPDEFGLARISRQKLGPSLPARLCERCPSCAGGYRPKSEVEARKLLREIRRDARPAAGGSYRVSARRPVLDDLELLAARHREPELERLDFRLEETVRDVSWKRI